MARQEEEELLEACVRNNNKQAMDADVVPHKDDDGRSRGCTRASATGPPSRMAPDSQGVTTPDAPQTDACLREVQTAKASLWSNGTTASLMDVQDVYPQRRVAVQAA